MAGTIPLSMTQQFDEYGKPLSGGQLYIIQAGTVSTPQDAFQDVALLIKQPYPMTLDAAGRVPQFFLDDSVSNQVKIRLQDQSGVVQLAADNVLIIGPSITGGGGGGGTPIAPGQLITTGMMAWAYGIAEMTGYVRLNGRTIGSASSGATELQSNDTNALFLHLWNADANLVVVGGRGVSASADWGADKQLTLPDFRSRTLAGLSKMGNSVESTLFSSVTFTSGSADVLGSKLGVARHALAKGNIPTLTSTHDNHSITVQVAGLTGKVPFTTGAPWVGVSATSGADINVPNTTGSIGSLASFTGLNDISVTSLGTINGEFGTGFDTVSPMMLVTFYIRL